jgi:hypothetical protein
LKGGKEKKARTKKDKDDRSRVSKYVNGRREIEMRGFWQEMHAFCCRLVFALCRFTILSGAGADQLCRKLITIGVVNAPQTRKSGS